MEESASDCRSRENATGVDWNKLPSELWLEIFSYMSPVNIVGVLRYVSTLFESYSFHPSLWRQIDLTDWNGPTTHLDSFIENLSPVIDQVSEHLRTLSFCQITGNIVFDSDKRWLFYKFSNIVSLEITDCDCFTAEILAEIRQNCKNIEALVLSGCCEVNDEALEVVSKFEHLTRLDIEGCCFVSNKGVNFIAEMSGQILIFLSRGVHQLSDRSIVNLVTKQTKIESLVLSGENLTDYSVINACLHLANLKHFEIFKCKNFTDRSIYALCGKVKLERLHLENIAEEISTRAFNSLFRYKPMLNLKELGLYIADAVVDETIDAISSGCPHLDTLELTFCSKVTDKSIEKLIKSCRKLEIMCLNGMTSLKGDWLAGLDHYLPKLHCLCIAFCSGISDDKIKHLLSRKSEISVYTNKKKYKEFPKDEHINCCLRKISFEEFQ
ncbi:F-box and leucine-rich repeat protein 13-like [Clavelina lepadiformis]|uniref:F-box and leucine-rich repeat protein 13-like n=1 Tax=Clavelina lepadiformis TaxID=159417 RepID=UPI00404125E9